MNAPQRDERGVLLVIDGELPEPEFVRSTIGDYALVVAADGAALQLETMGIAPDLVIGDLDTVGPARARLESSRTRLVEDPDQQRNDLEKAIAWIGAQGHRSIDMMGIGGGMTDHVLNNFSVVARFADSYRLRVVAPECEVVFVTDRLEFAANPGARVSLIPLPRARLSTEGLQWELRDEVLEFGVREGASNRALTETVSLTVHSGVVAMFLYRSST